MSFMIFLIGLAFSTDLSFLILILKFAYNCTHPSFFFCTFLLNWLIIRSRCSDFTDFFCSGLDD